LVRNGLYVDLVGPANLSVQGERMSDFSCGLARVFRGGRYGFVDTEGKFVVPPSFEDALDFTEGLCAVKVSGRWGFIDRRGTMAIRPQFHGVRPFSEGKAAASLGEKWGFIDHAGKRVIPFRYANALSFRDSMAGVYVVSRSTTGTGSARRMRQRAGWGFIDATGRTIVKPIFDGVRSFSDGLAAVAHASAEYHQMLSAQGLRDTITDHRAGGGDAWGYVDRQGSQVIDCKFGYTGDFRGGLAPARNGAAFPPRAQAFPLGYINRSGDFVIQPKFDFAREFHEGLAAVAIEQEQEIIWNGEPRKFPFRFWGYIDIHGKSVVRHKYLFAEDFRDGHALVTEYKKRADQGEVRALLNKEGRSVWSMEFD
jgi:hypothetical protein